MTTGASLETIARTMARLCAGMQGRGCASLPMDDDILVETGREETGDTDTGEDNKPCAIPEEEPNGSANQALTLPLETKGGTFLGDLDLDYWLIDFEHEGWLQVSVNAGPSAPGPGLLLSWTGAYPPIWMRHATVNIRMIFPTGPDRFHAMVGCKLARVERVMITKSWRAGRKFLVLQFGRGRAQ